MIPSANHQTAHGASIGARVALKVRIVNTQPEYVPALAALQRVVFPTLDESELFTEAKYHKHIELFAPGQFTALVELDGHWVVVGATSTYRTDFDFEHIQHSYIDAIAHGWLTNHNPNGEWLYGVDVSVHPQFRGLHIGRRLYDARRALARELNLRGEIAGALIPGYAQHPDLTVAQYVLKVAQGRLSDPTLTMQLRNGFRVKGVLYEHISDPRSQNCAALIVRENPAYQPSVERHIPGVQHTHPVPAHGARHGHVTPGGHVRRPQAHRPAGLSTLNGR
jgi:GNAT superfamily N-acetyltransferase